MRDCKQCSESTEVILTKRKTHNVFQCQNCFGQVGTPISREEALRISPSWPKFKMDTVAEYFNGEELAEFHFKSEEQLSNWFINTFNRWFYIFSEVSSINSSEDATLRIDYILYPKSELINNGFHRSYFGVEVKHFLPSQGHARKTSRALWQAVSYNDTFFDLKQSHNIPKSVNRESLPTKVELDYTLIFSNLSFKHDYRKFFGLESNFQRNQDEDQWHGMLLLANHANVGVINLDSKNNSDIERWNFLIGRSLYFSCSTGTELIYKLHDINLVTKKRKGNF